MKGVQRHTAGIYTHFLGHHLKTLRCSRSYLTNNSSLIVPLRRPERSQHFRNFVSSSTSSLTPVLESNAEPLHVDHVVPEPGCATDVSRIDKVGVNFISSLSKKDGVNNDDLLNFINAREFCDLYPEIASIANPPLISSLTSLGQIHYKHNVGSFGTSGHSGCDILSSQFILRQRSSGIRCLHSSQSFSDKDALKPSSKVEESVKAIKEDKEEQEKTHVAPAKRTLWKKIEDEILHYYHGFRLLFIDIRITIGLINQILHGKSLTRREHRQLVRTTSDVFRLVPFSVFIIVPFMELLLPVFLKFFPGMLPSTFQQTSQQESKMKAQLKMKIEMAKFLQKTLDDMAISSEGRSSQKAKEFAEFFAKIRTSGGEVSNTDIIKFSKLFEDEITLDSLSRQQLTALCHLLEISTIGNTTLLRFQLRMRLRSLVADDRTIELEGIDSLNVTELQQACKARGMRALGVPEERLRGQLQSWLQLSLHEKVPPSLLLLSRAIYLPRDLPASAQLQATISALPDFAAVQAKAAIGEREGKVDNKTRIELLKEEERKIREEKQEQLQDEEAKKAIDKEELVDEIGQPAEVKTGELRKDSKLKTPIAVELLPNMTALLGPDILRHNTAKTVQETIEGRLTKHVPHPLADLQKDPLTVEDLEKIENALDVLGTQKRELYIETEELQELKEELAEYQEDVKDLDVISKETKVHESKGARRLYNRVNRMIGKMENVVHTLQKEGHDVSETKASPEIPEAKKIQLVAIQELIEAIQNLQNVSDPSRMERIADVLENLDDDGDGKIEVEDVLKIIDLIERENLKLNPQQIGDIADILEKEELLIEKSGHKGGNKDKEVK